MHELAITQRILEIAIRHAREANASSISDIFLVIGQMSSIIDDSVQFYWDIISEETLAHGARLHFRRIPTEFLCDKCDHRFSPGETCFSCPLCGCKSVTVVAGEEFFLEAINVEPEISSQPTS